MSALELASECLRGTNPASTGSWKELTSPSDQGFERRLVFTSGTSSGAPNSTIPVNDITARWLQFIKNRDFRSRNQFAFLPEGNVVLTWPYDEIYNSASGDTAQWFPTNPAARIIVQTPQATSHYGWSEPKVLDHNRVRPRRRFTLMLNLAFRGRPKALPIDDFE
jgi:hypothetical protein